MVIHSLEDLQTSYQSFKDEDEYGKGIVAEALGCVGKPAVESPIRVLNGKNKHIRKGVGWALGNIGDTRAVEPLIIVLRDKDISVQWQIVWALEKIEGPIMKPFIQTKKNTR
ncbi:MAG: hypothetical protein AYK19_10705 [Theionarchaea archaeon DG-70-1]|nr:MAG: hypothetical protein AYK19_10705 [Theionarchaea archaeon DG-70-1]